MLGNTSEILSILKPPIPHVTLGHIIKGWSFSEADIDEVKEKHSLGLQKKDKSKKRKSSL